ncbi:MULTISPECIES: hypothetical protein [Microbulbifer]|nr:MULTISPECIES: hypothetical protein [Microbulbifer]
MSHHPENKNFRQNAHAFAVNKKIDLKSTTIKISESAMTLS